MGLINERILKDAVGHPGDIPAAHLAYVTLWAESVRDGTIRAQNETQLEGDFKSRILEGVLGYHSFGTSHPQTVKAKVLMGSGEVDLALGDFSGTESKILAPFELKGARTSDLDAPMPGRKITPVQQAWNYANAVRGVKWVLVSNMLEIRLYAFGEGNRDFARFDLSRIDDPAEYAKLQLLLSADNLLGGATADLLKRSKDAEKDISNRLYGDYKGLRETLIEAVHEATGKADRVKAIGTAQKVLDRILFVAFAEDTALLPGKSLERAFGYKNPYDPRPIWHNFKALFRAIDAGSKPLEIPRYNGGLFKPDDAIDTLELPDDVCAGFMTLGAYNFASEVSVTVLGHIFEQSVTDVERLLARARGEEPEDEKKSGTSGRRKRDGIVYTPDYIARFIVEKTLGVHVEALFAAVMVKYAKGGDPADYESLRFNARKGTAAWTKQELTAWTDYQMQLQLLRVVDPACGSGVFLVTAFDFLRAEYDRVNKKLSELRGSGGQMDALDVDREILSQNLYGVDVNEESVEITKLSLWIKTARRGKVLDSLDHTIRIGDSLIEDVNFAYLKHGFEWRRAFPEVFAAGGVDVVIGNPPYVRMELIKAMKPYLEQRFEVVSDRADLYCYFYERGLRLLKDGGRLGYISSSTFFKTGSGSPLRQYLLKSAAIETVTDFGDLQIFEGVTTYPAILTMRKETPPEGHAIAFLKLASMPDDFEAAFDAGARPFPQGKLGSGSWELEDEALRRLREKIVSRKRKLKEVYGSPLYGIKTGLNEAFVIDRATRDRLVIQDPKSSELLKPFLEGKDLKRWRAEPRDLFLLVIPKGWTSRQTTQLASTHSAGDAFAWLSDNFPAIAKWLVPYEQAAASRTDQGDYWWELRACDYYREIESPKLIYGEFSGQNSFSVEEGSQYINNKCYFFPTNDLALCAFLNSKLFRFFIEGQSVALRGNFPQLHTQYIELVPLPDALENSSASLSQFAASCQRDATILRERASAFRRRIPDLCPPDREPKLNGKLHDWHELTDFAAFRAAVKTQFKTDIPLKERAEWEAHFNAEKAEVARLSAEIARNEAEINAIVYRLFDLNPDEIALLERSLQ